MLHTKFKLKLYNKSQYSSYSKFSVKHLFLIKIITLFFAFMPYAQASIFSINKNYHYLSYSYPEIIFYNANHIQVPAYHYHKIALTYYNYMHEYSKSQFFFDKIYKEENHIFFNLDHMSSKHKEQLNLMKISPIYSLEIPL